jgi:hypothetical protein
VARKASFPDEQNERKQNEAVERKREGKKTERNAEKKERGEKRARLELNNPEIWGAN